MKFSQTKTLAFSLLLFVNHGSAQTDLQTTEKTLDIIAKFSMSMCGNPALQGSSKSVEVSAAAKTEVSKLVKQLAEIKLETAAKFQSTDYQGLLQQDLVQVLKDSANCKQSIFNDLKDRLLPSKVSQKPIAAADKIVVSEVDCKRTPSPPGSATSQLANIWSSGRASLEAGTALTLSASTQRGTVASKLVLNCEFWGQGLTVKPDLAACKRLGEKDANHPESSNWFGRASISVQPGDQIFLTLWRIESYDKIIQIVLGELNVELDC